ncbi:MULTISPECIES: YheV family putative zinc ribbon protein [unclassified Thalassolituus]|mgnify:FL=1|uniref:YheV family putative zinc ribbon protein n=1 Tax=unclassified Thalassolituus TaxID=2624967 RepID=UPI0025F38F6F|nr:MULTISPECIES: YheV family putative zinc ribbon protein [unclassified Thalassolituus]|tara:strand:- start:2953 stop:3240 length:288 start_codon:yes stop_codon:yes gene_type:complete
MSDQPMKRPRRFIAGAVCPKCSEMDKTVMFTDDAGEEVRECIACGYKQTYSEQLAEDAAAEELVTRVTPEGKAIYDEGEQPLKIIGLSPQDSDNT